MPPTDAPSLAPEPAMDHATIERERLIDRYLLGQLDDDELARFEEHYLGCARCLDELEAAQGLQEGLRSAAAEDAAGITIAFGAYQFIGRRLERVHPGFLIAAVLVLLAMPVVLTWQLVGVQGQLDQTQAELDATRAPQPGTRIAYLDAERGGADPEAPTQRLRLPAEPGWIVLAVVVDQPEASPAALRASLLDPDGTTVWEAGNLHPDEAGTLTLSLHSSTLHPGDYQLRLVSGVSERRYAFRVLAP